MLVSNGTEMTGQGRWELDRRVARPEEGRDAVSLGDVVLEIEGEEKKKTCGSVSDPPAERSLLHPSRRATATTGPGPQPGR